MKRILLALLILAPFQAHALIVSSSVGSYDVTYSYVDGKNSALDNQVWWGSSNLAREFAALVGSAFGLLNGSYGAFFAYANSGDDTYVAARQSGGTIVTGYVDEDNRYYYAFAQRVQGTTGVPEPGTLALLGAGLIGFGINLRRRKA